MPSLSLFDGDAFCPYSVEQKVCCFRLSVNAVSVVDYLESASHLCVGDTFSVSKEL